MNSKPFLCTDCGRRFRIPPALAQHCRDTHSNPAWSPAVKAPKAKPEPQIPICPMCGEPAQLSDGRFGIKAECCGMRSWGLRPLVSKGTHIARIRAHAAFDPCWKSGRLSRGEAYRRLALLMNMDRRDCHIALMSYEDALRVPEVLAGGAIFDETRFGERAIGAAA